MIFIQNQNGWFDDFGGGGGMTPGLQVSGTQMVLGRTLQECTLVFYSGLCHMILPVEGMSPAS